MLPDFYDFKLWRSRNLLIFLTQTSKCPELVLCAPSNSWNSMMMFVSIVRLEMSLSKATGLDREVARSAGVAQSEKSTFPKFSSIVNFILYRFSSCLTTEWSRLTSPLKYCDQFWFGKECRNVSQIKIRHYFWGGHLKNILHLKDETLLVVHWAKPGWRGIIGTGFEKTVGSVLNFCKKSNA